MRGPKSANGSAGTPDTSVQPARICSSINCRSEAVARIASPSVRMPRLRNSGTSFWKILAAVVASPSAECRPATSTSSQLATWSSEKSASAGLTIWERMRVQRLGRLVQGIFGARAFALQHREIEADRVADQHGVVEIARELRPRRGEPRRVRNRRVVEAVDARGVGRDRDIGPHQPPQRRRVGDPAAGQPHRPDLDHPRVRRIEPGRLRVHDHGVDRDQGRDTGPVHHRRAHMRKCSGGDITSPSRFMLSSAQSLYWRPGCPRNC